MKSLLVTLAAGFFASQLHASETPDNSALQSCVEFRNECRGVKTKNETEIAGEFADLSGKIMDLLQKLDRMGKLNSKDQAILQCFNSGTKTVLEKLAQCRDEGCFKSGWMGAYNDGANLACSAAGCLKGLDKTGTLELTKALCDVTKKVAKNIKCFGFNGFGGMWGVCATDIKNNRPIIPMQCRYSPTVAACDSNNFPNQTTTIENLCDEVVSKYTAREKLPSEERIGCKAKCVKSTQDLQSNCKGGCSNQGGKPGQYNPTTGRCETKK